MVAIIGLVDEWNSLPLEVRSACSVESLKLVLLNFLLMLNIITVFR